MSWAKVTSALTAFLTWLKSIMPELTSFGGGYGFRDWLGKRARIAELEAETKALRDVLGIRTDVERMSDAEVREYGERNGLRRVAKSPAKL